MATVESMGKLFSNLGSVSSTINKAIASIEKLERVSMSNMKLNLDASGAQLQIASLEQGIGLVEHAFSKVGYVVDELTSKINKAKIATSSWLSSLNAIAKEFLTVSNLQIVMNTSDQFNNIKTKLQNINDNSQDPASNELTSKIFASADRAYSSFNDTASYIVALESEPSGSFQNNNESLVFVELLQKSFQAGGSSSLEQQTGMNELVESMIKGQLNGRMPNSDLIIMMKDAPMLAAALSSYTGTSLEDLENLVKAGVVSSDIFKNAVFSASDAIDAKFSETNATFESMFSNLQNALLQSFGPVFVMLSEKLNETGMFDRFLEIVTFTFVFAADGVAYFLNALFTIYEFFSAYWTFIEPLIWGVIGALSGMFVLYTIINLVDLFALAWKILNAVMKANIFITIISVIIGLIALFWNLWATNDAFYEGFMKIWNNILTFFGQVGIFFFKVVFGMVNAIMGIKQSILEFFVEMGRGIIKSINFLIEKLNKIPGVSIPVLPEFEDFTLPQDPKAEAVKIAGENVIKAMEEDAASKALARDQKLQDTLDARATERASKESKVAPAVDMEQFSGFSSDTSGGGGNIGSGPMRSNSIDNIDKVNEVGKINDTVDISSEDIKMMRELAELNNIQNFVSLTPSVSFGDTHVRNEGDINTIIARITETLEHDIGASADMAFG